MKRGQVARLGSKAGNVNTFRVIPKGEGEDPDFELILPHDTVKLKGNDQFITVPKTQTPLQNWKNRQALKVLPDAQVRQEVLSAVEGRADVDEYADMALDELRERKKEAEARRDEQSKKFKELDVTIKINKQLVSAADDIKLAWDMQLEDTEQWKEGSAALQLQKNEQSGLHRLVQALTEGDVLNVIPEQGAVRVQIKLPDDLHTFVVSHDWFKAIEGSDGDKEGEWLLPFDQCAFEYRISNRIVIVVASQKPGEQPQGVAFVESRAGVWLMFDSIDDAYWWKQVRAGCIMLEAEIASHDVVRAPHALNVKREKAGKAPLFDYHVIDLAKRHKSRATPSDTPGHSGVRMRWHLVRKHWRHFANGTKTEIKWHSRGDPDLGFIDKDYKL